MEPVGGGGGGGGSEKREVNRKALPPRARARALHRRSSSSSRRRNDMIGLLTNLLTLPRGRALAGRDVAQEEDGTAWVGEAPAKWLIVRHDWLMLCY